MAEHGDLHGFVYVAKVGPGDNRAGISGQYKKCPAEAMQATFALEKYLRGDELSAGAW